jgi:hypothetical protein
MVRYAVKIRKVTKLDDKVIRNLRETIKHDMGKTLVRTEKQVGPALILLRIPSAPPLSASIFPQRNASIYRENTVSASRSNCSHRRVRDMLRIFPCVFRVFRNSARGSPVVIKLNRG